LSRTRSSVAVLLIYIIYYYKKPGVSNAVVGEKAGGREAASEPAPVIHTFTFSQFFLYI
jgi:hypothetical protein